MCKVSVIVPNYNHARYLPRRLESIAQQTYRNFEVILLDDQSTDESPRLLRQFAEEHHHARFIPSDINSGSPFAQWNRGIKLAQGEYIWIAESDDYAEPELLEKLVPLLEQNPKVGLAYAQSYLVDEENNILNSYEKNLNFIYKSDQWKEAFVKPGKEANREWLLYHNPIPNASGVLIRKSAYQKAGPADDKMRLNGDWLQYAKILNHSDLAFIPEHLNYFRVHRSTQREKARESGKVYGEIININQYIREQDSGASADADRALQKIANWWIGSLPYQKHTWQNTTINKELFRFFRKYKNNLRYRIFLTYVITYLRDALTYLGLLKPLKRLRSQLFPGKYFDY